ncbi:penicillin-binding protein 1B [Hydrocarboniclastica marina]|uniref:Penicillin-binding protein 1B n=1 Tax=Hydrocarboniclastica marina TaxID=2259620 RepID=A0A4P7XEV6_9ALTE|nr:penicillin-binding protein 1B [Hydrocarboniclastica marina]QCF24924.1 penicillin-binding protein 1B [Hydrocarboniclastica marina]
MTRSRSPRSRKNSRTSGFRRGLWRLALVALAGLAAWLVYLDAVVTSKFEGRRWEIPSRVYARPLELYEGAPVNAEALAAELQLLGYNAVPTVDDPGEYRRQGSRFTLQTRDFRFPDALEPSRRLQVTLAEDRVESMRVLSGSPEAIVRVDPVQIGGIYPNHGEDRVLVKLDQAPPFLRDALITVEDRDFDRHWGISLSGIARAAWANLQAGRVTQGGSTLTQQLVKNLYLSRDQTISRKVNEALMAILLDLHYSKDEILETYLNEVYLGQSGARSINGFGLASQFYFSRSFQRLELHHVALLVAMVKGPSYYDPRRHPQRALERRNLVLDMLAEHGVVPARQAQEARTRPLGVVDRGRYSDNRYPAFVDLVRRHLARDYQQADLQSEGLRIFTTLDPQVQAAAEKAVSETLEVLDPRESEAPLQAAAIFTGKENGEVTAVVGDRDPRFAGFNRALDANRSIGSLAKPMVYLTALAQPEKYTLMTPVKDEPFRLVFNNGDEWAPKNYSGQYHGQVPLHEALSHSYNLATVRLGLDVGIAEVTETFRDLGFEKPLTPYPSLFLGATTMAPIDVAELFQSIAASGFTVPLRTIREVTTSEGETLSRYDLEIEQRFSPQAMHLLHYAMQEVMREGTGRSVYNYVPSSLNLAGKTGTTDDGRDTWFAGFSGDHLGVVWLGRDGNAPTSLTGASGAMRVFGRVMGAIPQHSFSPIVPDGVAYYWVDPTVPAVTEEGCEGAVFLPFIEGSQPEKTINCDGSVTGRIKGWLNGWFD